MPLSPESVWPGLKMEFVGKDIPTIQLLQEVSFGAWDVEAVCRPAAVHLENKWICYYTGCARKNHRIGALIHEGDDLGFCGGPK